MHEACWYSVGSESFPRILARTSAGGTPSALRQDVDSAWAIVESIERKMSCPSRNASHTCRCTAFAMSIRWQMFNPLTRQLASKWTRKASDFARVAAHDSQIPKHLHPSSPPSKRRPPFAEHNQEARTPAGLAPLPVPLVPAQTITPSENYFVQRTPTRNLPVYQLRKSGGNLKQTRIRKISGKTAELLGELEQRLTPKPEWLKINPTTGHIEMKVS